MRQSLQDVWRSSPILVAFSSNINLNEVDFALCWKVDLALCSHIHKSMLDVNEADFALCWKVDLALCPHIHKSMLHVGPIQISKPEL